MVLSIFLFLVYIYLFNFLFLLVETESPFAVLPGLLLTEKHLALLDLKISTIDYFIM